MDRLTVWIAVLFVIGSSCFALGSVPLYFEHLSLEVVGATFFVGSLFFTTASGLQLYQAGGMRVFVWLPKDSDWQASIIQFVGTLFFNATTLHALSSNLDADNTNRLVWAPDALGSVCFLVSSCIAFAAIRRLQVHRPDLRWWIATLNLVGSVAFGLAAIASFVLPTTGEEVNVRVVNSQTFIGAVCFLVAAYMLVPQMNRERRTATP